MQPWLVAVVIAVLAPLFTYLGIARRTSGRIATTEASKLWEEAGSLRTVYRDEITRLRQSIEEIEARLDAVEIENANLRAKNSDLEREIKVLHAENEALRAENKELKARIIGLENNVST